MRTTHIYNKLNNVKRLDCQIMSKSFETKKQKNKNKGPIQVTHNRLGLHLPQRDEPEFQ